MSDTQDGELNSLSEEASWKPFLLTELFSPVRGRESDMANLGKGNTPLISAKATNNGLKGFVSSANNPNFSTCVRRGTNLAPPDLKNPCKSMSCP